MTELSSLGEAYCLTIVSIACARGISLVSPARRVICFGVVGGWRDGLYALCRMVLCCGADPVVIPAAPARPMPVVVHLLPGSRHGPGEHTLAACAGFRNWSMTRHRHDRTSVTLRVPYAHRALRLAACTSYCIGVRAATPQIELRRQLGRIGLLSRVGGKAGVASIAAKVTAVPAVAVSTITVAAAIGVAVVVVVARIESLGDEHTPDKAGGCTPGHGTAAVATITSVAIAVPGVHCWWHGHRWLRTIRDAGHWLSGGECVVGVIVVGAAASRAEQHGEHDADPSHDHQPKRCLLVACVIM
mmetsp:Transcript_49891/g.129951  ORF Transcript_49891/g.129951 Transcript_49891/m.129951 type:complete len:301 (-) Transcript_49891:51-953(-)